MKKRQKVNTFCFASYSFGFRASFHHNEDCQLSPDGSYSLLMVATTSVNYISTKEKIKRHLSSKGNKAEKAGKSSTKTTCSSEASLGSLGFDICGDSSIFYPSSSVEVDNTCQYSLQLADAGVPFPPVMPGPNEPGSCTLDRTDCNGQSCLNEVRNLFTLGKDFEEVTGFIHMGVDWSPCGQ